MSAPVLPGAEPFSAAGGRHGALVIHGFTGNTSSMRPLAEAFAAAGFTVEAPLLPGHGTAVEDMIPTRFEDWHGAAEEAYRKIAASCDKVVVAGLSMGGTLACRLAADHAETAGLIAINALVDPPGESDLQAMKQLVEGGMEVAPGIGSDIARPDVAESAYDGSPLRAALSLFEGVAALNADLGAIRCPVLIVTSRQDHVVPPASSDVLAARVSGPVERMWLDRSYHVATLDWDASDIEAAAVDFGRRVTA